MRAPVDSDDFPGGEPASATAPMSHRQQRTYLNPVLDQDFPDPAVLKADDGFYYAYGTQTLRGGKWINIQVTRSADLVHWEHVGDALPDKPEWAKTFPSIPRRPD